MREREKERNKKKEREGERQTEGEKLSFFLEKNKDSNNF
jgi:hypothetical protein